MESRLDADISIRLGPLDGESIDRYIQLGRDTYKEHYLHLWKDKIPVEYFQTYYTREKVRAELEDPNLSHFIIFSKETPIGIVKLNVNELSDIALESPSVLLEKIYILHAYSGKGIGSQVIRLIEGQLKRQGVRTLWLETMKKGRTLSFYQGQGFDVIGEKQLHYQNIKEEERPMFILSKKL
ncbi:MAG: GNAT family N-acetyltransferase [Flavobacteriaceae bacterium]|nr:GNAT family N-acetyltransferase [Flavobacteriaceae bacterium]